MTDVEGKLYEDFLQAGRLAAVSLKKLWFYGSDVGKSWVNHRKTILEHPRMIILGICNMKISKNPYHDAAVPMIYENHRCDSRRILEFLIAY